MLLAGIVIAAVIYPATVRELVVAGGVRFAPGWSLVRDDAGAVVSFVEGGDAALQQLRVGDRVVAVNGFPPARHGLGWTAFMDLRDGDRYPVRVRRGPESLQISLPARFRTNPVTLWLQQVPLLLISLAFFLTGIAVGYVRPRDHVARLYAVLAILAAIALIPFGVFSGEYSRGGMRVLLSVARVSAPIMLATGYQFFMAFPPGIPPSRRWRVLGWWLFAWSACLLPGAIVTAVATSGSARDALQMIVERETLLEWHDVFSTMFITTAFASSAAVIVRNQVVAIDAGQRRRLRWVMWGSLLGTLPMLLIFVWSVVAEVVFGQVIPLEQWVQAQGVAAMFLVLLPATFAYAVVRHHVIGVDVVLRRSVQYLLAKNVLRVAVILPIVLLVAGTLANPNQTVAGLLLGRPWYLVLAAVSAGALLMRKRLSDWLDQRFFREAANRDRILLDVIGRLGAPQENAETVARIVRDGIERALHPQGLEVCLPHSQATLLMVPPNAGETWRGVTSGATALARILHDTGAPLEVPSAAVPLSPEEEQWLGSQGTRLVVPIGGGGRRLHGMLLLGEKKSEEPYTADERRLLKSVTDQLAVVWENDALRSEVASAERQRHHVLSRLDSTINLFKECSRCGRCYDRSQEVCEVDGATVGYSFGIERTIQDRYRLDMVLGRGGMGVVYRAADLRLGRTVAIKLAMHPAVDTAEARRRFDLETRALARLTHPNIVAIHDGGTVGTDVAFLVMEHLTGATLRQELRHAGPATPRHVATWLAPILDAIAYAHGAGVIHRDLKPDNVYFAHEAGRVTPKVLDFGLVKLTHADAPTVAALTEPGRVLGTPAYMSPEQLMGTTVDERTDVFSLGVTVFEALTGSNPFQRGDAFATAAALMNETPSLHGDAGEVSDLDRVLQRCLAKRPQDRYMNVATMRDALLAALVACPPGTTCAASSRSVIQ